MEVLNSKSHEINVEKRWRMALVSFCVAEESQGALRTGFL